MNDRVERSVALIDMAIAKYNPVAILGLFSGGHDSITATHVAARHPRFSYPIHLNTGTGIPETLDFVRSTSAALGWSLREYNAIDCGQDYREIVAKYGFPGPGQHGTMYIRLKERPLAAAMREAKAGAARRRTVLLISGARSEESQRRMGHVEILTKDKNRSRVWLNIIHDWTKAECNAYIEANGLPRSPVVEKIHKSGECLCGAYAAKGEFNELEFWYPEHAAKLASFPSANGKTWGWGADRVRTPRPRRANTSRPMCHGCAFTGGPHA